MRRMNGLAGPTASSRDCSGRLGAAGPSSGGSAGAKEQKTRLQFRVASPSGPGSTPPSNEDCGRFRMELRSLPDSLFGLPGPYRPSRSSLGLEA